MGANTIFKIMIFSIMLNFSVGILMTAIPAFTPEFRGGMSYNETYSGEFVGGMNGTVTPSGNLVDEGDAIYRVLDTLNLGFISRFISSVDQYLFGFLNVLQALFGGMMIGADGDTTLIDMIFGSFKIILTIGYMVGAWMLWTGKDITD